MNARAPEASSARAPREYLPLRERASGIARIADRNARLEAFAQMYWDAFAPTGVSWAGFYVDHPGEPDDLRMTLAARRPGPACSPIGIHGACGQCLRAARILVVRDVRDLGAGYIACDPRDRSEVVVPCLQGPGQAWGVLDLDSHDLASFGPADAEALAGLLRLAGLST